MRPFIGFVFGPARFPLYSPHLVNQDGEPVSSLKTRS